jgi:hypothetical protein
MKAMDADRWLRVVMDLGKFATMQRDDAITRPQEHEAELRQLGIERLCMFGSTVRDEARPVFRPSRGVDRSI